jgi:DNA topoisomerase I
MDAGNRDVLPDPAAQAEVRDAGLNYVGDGAPGIRRRRVGKSFAYFAADGARVTDATVLERIRALAIPPAYRDVWICADPRGHVQATGRDARGRKQYRYHPRWRQLRDRGKFDRVRDFGSRLPALRRRIARDLRLPGLPRDKVLAIVASLLAETLVRVGNHEYARDNNSFGLTTLRNRHVRFPRGGAIFEFRGKSGKQHRVELGDARLARLLRRCQQLPGQRLFQYLGDDGQPHPIGSGDVNDYLRSACGEDFSAKDFRTWGGTLAAIAALVRSPPPADASERALAAAQAAAVREVAEQLGNTPAVCRGSYIHPAVFEAWRDGRLARCVGPDDLRGPRKLEAAALRFLAQAGSRPRARAAGAGTAARKKGPPVTRTVLPFPQSSRRQILKLTPVEDFTLPALS